MTICLLAWAPYLPASAYVPASPCLALRTFDRGIRSAVASATTMRMCTPQEPEFEDYEVTVQ